MLGRRGRAGRPAARHATQGRISSAGAALAPPKSLPVPLRAYLECVQKCAVIDALRRVARSGLIPSNPLLILATHEGLKTLQPEPGLGQGFALHRQDELLRQRGGGDSSGTERSPPL